MNEKEPTDQQIDIFDKHMENYNVETSAVHRKLQSKMEALRILRDELEKFRSERDQFKLMAETLQLRYSTIKRTSDFNPIGFGDKSSVASLLDETRQKNLCLATEVESLKQKLAEMQEDIQLLRSKSTEKERKDASRNRQSSSSSCEEAAWKMERVKMISNLESLKRKNAQLSFDLKAVIDEKEEAITERDAYKCKAHRLNHELLVALKANKSHPRIVDIDGLILESKFLQERLKICESELEISKQAAAKYKTMLDTKRKKGIMKFGSQSSDSILSHKQVKNILEADGNLPTKMETISDLKSLCLALLDSLNDKNIALNHQKKTNKILASKISDLEHRVFLVSCDNSAATSIAEYSPSQILLDGYCPSSVDLEPKSITITEDSGTISSEADESNKTSRGGSEDCMNSTASESEKSVLSSEYGQPCSLTDLAAIYEYKGMSRKPISNSVAKERLDDLKDLPPELAEMVQRALDELDMREFDEPVAERPEEASMP